LNTKSKIQTVGAQPTLTHGRKPSVIVRSHRYKRFSAQQHRVLDHIFDARVRSTPGMVYGYQLERNEALVSEPGIAKAVGVDRWVVRRVLVAGVEEGWWTRRPATRTYLLRDAHSGEIETHIAGPRDAHSNSNRPSIIKVLCLQENTSSVEKGQKTETHIDPLRDAHSKSGETHMNQTITTQTISDETVLTDRTVSARKAAPTPSANSLYPPSVFAFKDLIEAAIGYELKWPDARSRQITSSHVADEGYESDMEWLGEQLESHPDLADALKHKVWIYNEHHEENVQAMTKLVFMAESVLKKWAKERADVDDDELDDEYDQDGFPKQEPQQNTKQRNVRNQREEHNTPASVAAAQPEPYCDECQWQLDPARPIHKFNCSRRATS